MAIKKAAIIKAAEDLQKVLALTDPPIDLKAPSKMIQANILEASQLIEKTDIIKKSTKTVMTALLDGLDLEYGQYADGSKEALKISARIRELKGEETPAEETPAEETPAEETPAEEIKPKTKPKAEKKEPKPKPKAEKKEPKPKAPPRGFVVFDSIRKTPDTVENVCEKANAAMIAAGGKDNLKQTNHVLRTTLPLLIHVGVVEEKGGKIKLA